MAMLQPGSKPYIPPTLASDESGNWVNLEKLSAIAGISRSSISALLTQMHGPWLLHLGQRERISILESMATFYARLGYQRKEAYVLREVLGCLLDLLVCGREEDGYSNPSGIPPTAGLGIHNLHPVSGASWDAVGVRVSESAAGNDSILCILKYVCKVLGISLDVVGLVQDTLRMTSGLPPSLNDYDEDIVQELREPSGWPELQVGVVREAVAVAEALPGEPTARYLIIVRFYKISSIKTSPRLPSLPCPPSRRCMAFYLLGTSTTYIRLPQGL
jgi:hypothetical protein